MKTIPVSLLAAALLLPGLAFAESTKKGGKSHKSGRHHSDAAMREAWREAWREADVNRDDRLSREEFDTLPRIRNLAEEKRARLFARLDSDGDGFLSREDLEKKRREGRRQRMQRFIEMDADSSGGISLEEFRAGELFKKLPPEKQEKLFRKLDTDGDGQLTPKDRPEPPHWKHGAPQRMLRELDQDGDKALSFEEFRASPFVREKDAEQQERRFRSFDRNGDGKIDAADFPSPGDERNTRDSSAEPEAEAEVD